MAMLSSQVKIMNIMVHIVRCVVHTVLWQMLRSVATKQSAVMRNMAAGVVEIRDRRHVKSGQQESGRRGGGVTVCDKDSNERYSNDVAEKLGG